MATDENLLTAAALCSRLADNKELKCLSFGLYHRLISDLYKTGIENPSQLLGMSESELCKLGFDGDFSARLCRLLDTADEIEKMIDNYKTEGISLIGIDNEYYPELLLRQLQTLSPPVLFCRGNMSLMNKRAISVVGSRQPSNAGKIFANRLGKKIAESGYVLTSGGADGCDCIAESSATSNGGRAVLYLAVSLYRRMKNARIAGLINKGAICLVSDHNPSDAFNAGYAVTRNKYIYSSADIAVVCESRAEKGGSYNGAASAINGKFGKVAAFDNKLCYGNQMLIASGALAVQTADDAIRLADESNSQKEHKYDHIQT